MYRGITISKCNWSQRDSGGNSPKLMRFLDCIQQDYQLGYLKGILCITFIILSWVVSNSVALASMLQSHLLRSFSIHYRNKCDIKLIKKWLFTKRSRHKFHPIIILYFFLSPSLFVLLKRIIVKIYFNHWGYQETVVGKTERAIFREDFLGTIRWLFIISWLNGNDCICGSWSPTKVIIRLV